MVRAVYSVVLKRGEWVIELNDKPVVRCGSKGVGIQAAVAAASSAYAKGYKAHVLAQDGSRFRSVWINGKEQPVNAPGSINASGNPAQAA